MWAGAVWTNQLTKTEHCNAYFMLCGCKATCVKRNVSNVWNLAHTHKHTKWKISNTILVWIQWKISFKLLRVERSNDMAYQVQYMHVHTHKHQQAKQMVKLSKRSMDEIKKNTNQSKANKTKPNQINKKKPNKWFFDGRLQRQRVKSWHKKTNKKQ